MLVYRSYLPLWFPTLDPVDAINAEGIPLRFVPQQATSVGRDTDTDTEYEMLCMTARVELDHPDSLPERREQTLFLCPLPANLDDRPANAQRAHDAILRAWPACQRTLQRRLERSERWRVTPQLVWSNAPIKTAMKKEFQ